MREVLRDREGSSDEGGTRRLRYARHRLRRRGVAGWLALLCFAIALVVVVSRSGSGGKGRGGCGAGRRGAGGLLRWVGLASRGPLLPICRSAGRRWRLLAVIALVVLASESFAANGGGLRARDLTRTPALEVSGSRSQGGGEAGVRRKRVPELVALQWNPTSQPFPERSDSTVPPPVQPHTPLPPRLVPLPTVPDGAIVGLATWYGGVDGFGPEDTMANGSRFNPNDPTITAANRWPLGSWLRVCLGNRCIAVQVRDRGTFSHALDLSYAAFSQLAPPSTGVIDVTISRLH